MDDLVRYHCEVHDNENIEKFVVLSVKKHQFSYAHCLGFTKSINEDTAIANIWRNEFIAFGCDIMLFWSRKHHIQKKTMSFSNQKGKSHFVHNITVQRLNGQSFLWNAIKTDCKKIFF